MRARSTLLIAASLYLAVGCGDNSPSRPPPPPPQQGPAQFTQSTTNTFNAFPASAPGFGVGAQNAEISLFAPNTMFVGYNDNTRSTLLALDVSTVPITARATVPLPFSVGQVPASNINIIDTQTGLIATSDVGTGDNTRIHMFNPQTLASPADIITIDLSVGNLLSVNATGQVDSAGTGVTTFRANLPGGAVMVNIGGVNRLFVPFANLNLTTFDSNPGTVLVYDVTITNGSATAVRSGTIFTTDFNPISITAAGSNGFNFIYATLNGAFLVNGKSNGSVEKIDPTNVRVAANIPLGANSPSGKMIVNDSGTLGYVTSQENGAGIQTFEIDLNNDALSQTFTLPLLNPGTNFSVSAAVSADGNTLYVLAPGDAVVYSVDRATGATLASESAPTEMNRASPGQFLDVPAYMARRPGDPASNLFIVVTPLSMGATPANGSSALIDVYVPPVQ